jgi:hypothetical protein
VTGRYVRPNPGEIQQTAILRDVELPEVRLVAGQEAKVAFSDWPWLVVLNQECDLLFDRLARAGKPLAEGGNPVKKDKLLHTVLLCPAFPEDHVLAGTYVEDATKWSGNEKKILQQNRHERYHVLPSEDLVTEPLVLDFKLIVATHPEYLHRWIEEHPERVIAVLCPPYRDRLMQRFVGYFGRIAEPGEL